MRWRRRRQRPATVAIDPAGNVTAWDEEAMNLFGWGREEAIGHSLESFLIPARYRAAHKAGLERLALDKPARILDREFEILGLHRKGHEVAARLFVSRLPGHAGYIASVVPGELPLRAGHRIDSMVVLSAMLGLLILTLLALAILEIHGGPGATRTVFVPAPSTTPYPPPSLPSSAPSPSATDSPATSEPGPPVLAGASNGSSPQAGSPSLSRAPGPVGPAGPTGPTGPAGPPGPAGIATPIPTPRPVPPTSTPLLPPLPTLPPLPP